MFVGNNHGRQRWNEFLLRTPAQAFFETFLWIFYPYCIFRIWGTNWTFYSEMRDVLYSPVGLAAWLHIPFPASPTAIIAVQTLATLAAVSALFGFHFRLSALLFFLSFLLLDLWQNMFGFINVDIHLVWFGGILILCDLDRKARGTKWIDSNASLAFRLAELVTVLAYFQSGLAKLMQSGWRWALDGTTLQIGLLRQGIPLGTELSQYPHLVVLLSCGILLLELAFPLYYALPSLRRYLLTAAIAFHLGTWIFMGIDFSHLWIFSASVLFFAQALLDRKLGSHSSDGRLKLFIDRDCLACSKFARFIFSNDVHSKLLISTFETERAKSLGILQSNADAKEMIAVSPDGSFFLGPDAVSETLRSLPFPWCALGSTLKTWPLKICFNTVYPIFARYRKQIFGSARQPFCEFMEVTNETAKE